MADSDSQTENARAQGEASPVENTGDASFSFQSPVENPVDSKILAQEAEEALKNTGEKNTGEKDNLPSVEFFYGKVKQNGRWIKTGKIYWIYTTYQNGQRKRISPSRIYRREKGITSIEKCPYEGRVLEFRSRSLGFKYTGGSNDDGRLQGSEIPNARELDDKR